MGILPLTFLNGESASSLGITGLEKVKIMFDPTNIVANQDV